MKVRFELQIDDLIGVGERTLAASRVVKRIRLSGLISSALLGAILLYAMSGDSGPPGIVRCLKRLGWDRMELKPRQT